MTGRYEQVEEAAHLVRALAGGALDLGVVLGSGLGPFTDRLERPVARPYSELPHWPASSVVGHAGRLVIGTLRGRRLAALSGRAHYYEGHDLGAASFAVRVLGVAGVRTLILTNAAGGINPSFEPGTLMVIDDHLNLMGGNPLIGPNEERFGPRFPDMSEVYSRRLRQVAAEAAAACGIALASGVYAGVHGPSYETPAEIRYLRTIGADAVGMSTVPEALAARHMGMEVLGISCITNAAAGVLATPLVHDDVMAVAERVQGEFAALLEEIVGRL